MNEILMELASKVSPREVIYFLIMVGLFSIIGVQELGFRRKDKLFIATINSLTKEINENGNQLTQLIAIVNFLSFHRKSEGSKDENRS